MKKGIQILSAILCLIIPLLSFGCKGWFADEHKFLYKKLSEIPIEYEKINIGPLFVFDDELFICCSYTPSLWWVNWKGKIPLTMYRFDIKDYSLQYAGYFSSYTFNGYICKNK